MSTFGNYKLLGLIGRGSATEVFRAKRFGVEGFEKSLAIKRLTADAQTNAELVEAFIQGAKRALRLSHSNVVQVLELGEAAVNEQRGVFVATELVVGAPWARILELDAEILRAQGAGSLLYVGVEVARALDHAHRRRDAMGRSAILHGGLTPDNVFITDAGEVKVADFGTAGLGRRPLKVRQQISVADDLRALLQLVQNAFEVASLEPEKLAILAEAIESGSIASAADLHEELLVLSYAAERGGAQELSALVAALRKGTTAPPPAAYGEELANIAPQEAESPRVVSSFHPHKFVGRSDELASVGRRLAIAAKRKLQVVAISGAPGVGKTRLVAELRERLRRGALNLAFTVATCPEGGAEEPGSAIAAMLRSLFGILQGQAADRGALLPALGTLGLTGELAEAVASELEASDTGSREQPLPLRLALRRMMVSLADDRLHVFAWDDAQHMDGESALLLRQLTEELAGKRIFILLSHRLDSAAHCERVPVDERVALSNLSQPEVSDLIRARLRVANVPHDLLDFLYRESEGHPMHAEEILREALHAGGVAVVDKRVQVLDLESARPVPDTLPSLISNRARRFGQSELSVLRAVAALGGLADIERVAAVVDLSLDETQDCLERLDGSGLVAVGVQRAEVPSQLVRDALLMELTEDQRGALWLQAAEVLERHANGERPALVEAAWRFEQAGHADRAAQTYVRAALVPQAGAGIERPVPLLLRSLALVPLDGHSDHDLSRSLRLLAESVRLRQRQPELLQAIRRVESHWLKRDIPDSALKLDGLLDMARVLALAAHHVEARRLLQSALPLAQQADARVHALRLALADTEIALGSFPAALEQLQEVLTASDLSKADRHEALVLSAHAFGQRREFEAAQEALSKASKIRDVEDQELSCRAEQVGSLVHALAGDWQESALASAKAAAAARASGLVQQEISCGHYEGEALVFLEEWARAYAAFRKSLALATDAGAERWVIKNRMQLSFLEAREGSVLARKMLGQCLIEAERARTTQDVAKGRLLIGRLLTQEGAFAAARRELELAREVARSIGHSLLVVECEAAQKALAETTGSEGES